MTEQTKTDEMVFTDNCSRLPEAPALAWTVFQSPAGFDWRVTFRAGLPEDQAVIALSQIRKMIEIFEKGAAGLNWLPIVDGRSDINGTPASRSNTNGTKTFQARELIGNVNEGKAYWKIKGVPFTQHGVTIWPEVLEDAGFNLDELNPMDGPRQISFIAHYIENDNGNPKKVVKLEAA